MILYINEYIVHWLVVFKEIFKTRNVPMLKDKVEFWSCDCIVKETWNQQEKVVFLGYKYWCVLQGSGIIRKFAQS